MRLYLLAAALLSLAFAPAAYAKADACRDAKGHFAKCPAAAPATPAPAAKATQCRDAQGHFAKCGATASAPPAVISTSSPASRSTMASASGGHPVCVKGKACGNSCIAKDKVCHK